MNAMTYNQRRPGRGMERRAPYEVFKAGSRKPAGQEEGEESSVGTDLGEAGCQVITILVQSALRKSQSSTEIGLTHLSNLLSARAHHEFEFLAIRFEQ